MATRKPPVYEALIESIFQKHFTAGSTAFEFDRTEIQEAAEKLGIKLPENKGDVLYSYRFRKPLPPSVQETSPDGFEWIIELAGAGRYRFRLARASRIVPNPNMIEIKIPDSTPEIVMKYAQGDEQALLAKVRYNRLIDIFLGITSYSLQNHLRTTVMGMGQIEIDELYVGVNRHGAHYVVPVQAKGGKDQIGVVQTNQDIRYCREKFPQLICRAVSAQFMPNGSIALFELYFMGDELRIVDEKHYRLVGSREIHADELKLYRESSGDEL